MRSCYVGVVSRQLRIRIVGLLVVLLSGVVAVGIVVPACGFEAPNLVDTPSDAPMALFDSPPDVFIPDAAPCSSLIKTCVSGTVLRACQTVGQLPAETTCEWDCSEIPEPHCRVLMPSGGAVTSQDLDPAMAMSAGLQKRTFTSITQPGSINTDTGAIQIGFDSRQSGTGVRNGIDFKVVNGVGIFRALELEFKGIQTVRVTGSNALALVGIDKIHIGDGTQFDLRGSCTGRTAGPGGKQGGAGDGDGSGTGAGGAGDNTGVCSGGGGAGNSEPGGPGGGRTNGGGTAGNATITMLTGGAGGGGGGTGGEGGGGGGAIQLVSNGPITLNGTLGTVGINAGGCGGKGGPCGGGAGAGGAILIEGRTVDFGNAYLAANGGGGGGAANGSSGEQAQTTNRANGGNGSTPIGPNNDGGDGGDGGDDGSSAAGGTVRDGRGGGGGGGVGWIRITTKSGSTGGSVFMTPDPPSASTGTANVQ